MQKKGGYCLDGTTAFLFGLIGAILGSAIGGYLNYRGGVQVARHIEKNKVNKARRKIIYQLRYILNALKSSDIDKAASVDAIYLISEADLVDAESEKIIYFLERWKEIQFDARKSQLNSRALAVSLMKQIMNPLVEDIKIIIQKYHLAAKE